MKKYKISIPTGRGKGHWTNVYVEVPDRVGYSHYKYDPEIGVPETIIFGDISLTFEDNVDLVELNP